MRICPLRFSHWCRHPDRAEEKDKEEAEKKFVEISKAHQALTDEAIRKNWEEYGNPDGQKSKSDWARFVCPHYV